MGMKRSSETTRILIVAEDPRLSDGLRSPFASDSYQIRVIRSTEETDRILNEFKPHLIILGLSKSGSSEHDFVCALQQSAALFAHHEIPVILVSNQDMRDRFAAELFARGLAGWYVLPIGPHEIHEIIQNVLIQNRSLKHESELMQEVKRSEYRYRDLLENASDLILTLDESARLTSLNNRFFTLTGFEKSEWLNRSFLDLIHPDRRTLVRKQLEQVQHGRSRRFETEILSVFPDSPVLSFSLTPILLRGTIQGAMVIGRDVTEEKRLERDIHDLESFNESIIQSMESGLLTLDLKGRITSLNQAGEKILEWSAREIAGKTLFSVFLEEEARILLSDSAGVAPLTLNQEARLTVKSGRQIFVGFNKTDWIDTTGEKVGMLISFREITQLKQMQSEVLRMDRLASLGVLASGIAHEIKNPLAGIKMMAQACEEEMDASDPRKEYLTRIVRQVNRLDDLLKTFFTFAKPRKPDRSLHALGDILEDVLQLIEKKLSYQDITLSLSIPDTLPRIPVDSQQMQQVFLNLMLNAIDALPQGGDLSVWAARDSVDDEERPALLTDRTGSNFIRVAVSDTGPGIPGEILNHVFDPFFTTKSDGMGLGLSIVYRIIQEHQGEIRVTSESGKGTTFHIWLPSGESV